MSQAISCVSKTDEFQESQKSFADVSGYSGVLATELEGPVEETLDATDVTTLAPLLEVLGETLYELTSLPKFFPTF